MASPPKITLINGRTYDHGQCEIRINGTHYPMVKSITYSQKLERGKAKGTSPVTRSYTRGALDADGSLEMYKTTDGGSLQLIRDLGDGFLEKDLSITVSFGVDGDPVTVDELVHVRLGGTEGGSSEGTDPNVDKFPLTMKGYKPDGKQPLNGVSL